ncbi:BTB/POZ protein [Phycomyces blakesleeanus]|uniref:BTB/POZ protein n=1 Tax=Phycomyces blakesleeanus TaxID=4837 RepID=A0ABR3ATL3_PHYBL
MSSDTLNTFDFEIILQKTSTKENSRQLASSIRAFYTIIDSANKVISLEAARKDKVKNNEHTGIDLYLWEFKHSIFHVSSNLSATVLIRFEDKIRQLLCPTPSIDLSSYADSPDFSDVTIKVIKSESNDDSDSQKLKSRDFRCHKVVLAGASPWFKALFKIKMSDSNSKDVTIRGISPEMFEKILVLIYSSEYNVKDLDEASKILKVAERIEISTLCNLIFAYLKSNINNKTNYRRKDIETACKNFIKHNAATFVRSKEIIAFDSESVIKILETNNLSPPVNEEKLYDAVLSWR